MKKPVKCLLIDDDNDDKDFFSLALKHVYPDVILHYSCSGEDAIKHLTEGDYKPDYIFLDLNMMPMGGMETLTELKKISACADVPIIIYSTTINEDIKYKTLALGAFDHFEKPMLHKDLEEYLKRIMQVN